MRPLSSPSSFCLVCTCHFFHWCTVLLLNCLFSLLCCFSYFLSQIVTFYLFVFLVVFVFLCPLPRYLMPNSRLAKFIRLSYYLLRITISPVFSLQCVHWQLPFGGALSTLFSPHCFGVFNLQLYCHVMITWFDVLFISFSFSFSPTVATRYPMWHSGRLCLFVERCH